MKSTAAILTLLAASLLFACTPKGEAPVALQAPDARVVGGSSRAMGAAARAPSGDLVFDRVEVFEGRRVRIYRSEKLADLLGVPKGVCDPRTEFVLVESGSFSGLPAQHGGETPEIQVESFLIGRMEVTEAVQQAIRKSRGQDTNHVRMNGTMIEGSPFDFASDDAWRSLPVEFGGPGHSSGASGFAEQVGFRLPSEAEWVYVALDGEESLAEEVTADVARKEQSVAESHWTTTEGREAHVRTINTYGVHDLPGGLAEWVADAANIEPYRPDALTRFSQSDEWEVDRDGEITWRNLMQYCWSGNSYGDVGNGGWVVFQIDSDIREYAVVTPVLKDLIAKDPSSQPLRSVYARAGCWRVPGGVGFRFAADLSAIRKPAMEERVSVLSRSDSRFPDWRSGRLTEEVQEWLETLEPVDLGGWPWKLGDSMPDAGLMGSDLEHWQKARSFEVSPITNAPGWFTATLSGNRLSWCNCLIDATRPADGFQIAARTPQGAWPYRSTSVESAFLHETEGLVLIFSEQSSHGNGEVSVARWDGASDHLDVLFRHKTTKFSTRLAWRDVTGDGVSELIWMQTAPEGLTAAESRSPSINTESYASYAMVPFFGVYSFTESGEMIELSRLRVPLEGEER